MGSGKGRGIEVVFEKYSAQVKQMKQNQKKKFR